VYRKKKELNQLGVSRKKERFYRKVLKNKKEEEKKWRRNGDLIRRLGKYPPP